MLETPRPILEFLRGKRIAVAGVSRSPNQAANAVFRKLRASGYDAVPVNPNASEVEGVRCYPDLRSIPGHLDGVVIATHPDIALDLVRQCEEVGVSRVWFHRSFGEGSVSDAAVRECETHGIRSIVGGCPLMYCQPVDFAHRCMGWWLLRRGRIGEGHLEPAGVGGRA
jgi:predicted CoA-binding protein